MRLEVGRSNISIVGIRQVIGVKHSELMLSFYVLSVVISVIGVFDIDDDVTKSARYWWIWKRRKN